MQLETQITYNTDSKQFDIYYNENYIGSADSIEKASLMLSDYMKKTDLSLKMFYEAQSSLDSFILLNKKEPMEKEEYLSKTLLALMVEVAELANATRCFKYWSKKESESKEVLLEEYVDIMHFFLSIGLQLGFSVKEIEEAYMKKNNKNFERQLKGY